MEIRNRQLSELEPYARNSRKHSTAQIEQLVRSLSEFGWTNPVLVDGASTIIAGHGRVMAAKKIAAAGGTIPRWPDIQQVPTIELSHLTQEQARAYVIADNQLALESSWDKGILSSELQELGSLNYDLGLLGFDESVLAQLVPAGIKQGLTDADDVPAPQAAHVARRGEICLLGDHRLACGDSTTVADVSALLDGVKPHLMVTDPPYGVEYDANWRNEAARHSEGMGNRALGAGAVGKVANDDRADWTETWKLFPGDVAYVWHAGRYASTVQASLEASGFEIRSQVIWAKSRFAISRGHYHWQHEPCWYVVRKGQKGHWGGARDQSTLWTINHSKSETGHSTQKPVECMRRPMENNSSPGQAVYEPFSGSGTSIIAAEQIGRICFAIEIEPAYVDVAIRRWQSFTGRKALLAADGRAFADIETERVSEAAAA